MKKKGSSLKEKSSIIASYIIVCIVMLIIVTIVVASNSRKNVGIASRDNQELPKAISEVIAKTPNENSGTFHYEESSETGLDGNLIKVPVPTGYVGSCVADEMYVNGVTTEGVREHHGGYVIYEKKAGESNEEARTTISNDLTTAQKERNQYVWVPISDSEVENMYHTSSGLLYGNYYTFTANGYSINESTTGEPSIIKNNDMDHKYMKQYMEGISASEFLQEMRKEFYEMLVSVKTYGGFYIGRYETGNINKKKQAVVKGNSDLGGAVWYKMYLRCRSLRGTSPVHTGLIWGIQFDETLKWLIDSGEKTALEVGSNSSSWGNYKDVTFSYTTTKGITKTKQSTSPIPSGSAEYTKANNIYDLAGNFTESTLQLSGTSNRCARSGYYAQDSGRAFAGMRAHVVTYSGEIGIGCRVTLYLSTY